MEQLAERFYENLMIQSQLSATTQPSYKASSKAQVDIRDPEQMKAYLEQVMHHYLPKKVPQTKVKFYQLNGETLRIEDEFIFVAEQMEQLALKDTNNIDTTTSEVKQLLSLDISTMLKMLQSRKQEEERIQLEKIEQQRKKDKQKEEDDEVSAFQMNDELYEEIGDCLEKNDKSKTKQVNNQLWVDKYTSLKFFDLLTDEVTNRNVLTWIKTWDELVFPENPVVNLKMPQSMLKPFQHSGIRSAPPTSFVQHADMYTYKNKKVIMLYGPPGTGKSTMARVLAKHCGYQAIEINASDERTGEKLLEKIKNAISMNSHFSKQTEDSQKPVCLIVDEVDGALANGGSLDSPKGIQMLVDYLKKCINYQASKAQAEEDDDLDLQENEEKDENKNDEEHKYIKKPTKKSKKNTDVIELKRPIIFICNDLYSRALFPLKDIALTVKVGESSPQRLIQRLRYICKQENVSIDDQILRELSEETNFDARSCINTLQFLVASQQESGERITVGQAIKAAGSMNCSKDSFENIFNVGDQIMIKKDKSYASNIRLLNEVKVQVHALGDSELLNDFIYHNYNSAVNYFDDDMEKTAFYLETLSRADCNDHYIRRTQNYELQSTQYLPAYAFKKFCAGNRGGRFEYPREVRGMYFEKKKYDSIFYQLLDLDGSKFARKGIKKVKQNEQDDEERYKIGRNTSLQSGLRRQDFKTDVLPYIYHMIHPNIREINTQLFTKHERQSFQTAIEIMVLLDIQLKPEVQTGDTQKNETYQQSQIAMFEPDIGSLVMFKDGRKEFMRNKTQILVLQNYESIKQKMLTSENGQIGDFLENNKKKLQVAVAESKLNGYGFLAGIVQQKNMKKRNRDLISGGDQNLGRFIYKFKEGHSKNFKRELFFDYFL